MLAILNMALNAHKHADAQFPSSHKRLPCKIVLAPLLRGSLFLPGSRGALDHEGTVSASPTR